MKSWLERQMLLGSRDLTASYVFGYTRGRAPSVALSRYICMNKDKKESFCCFLCSCHQPSFWVWAQKVTTMSQSCYSVFLCLLHICLPVGNAFSLIVYLRNGDLMCLSCRSDMFHCVTEMSSYCGLTYFSLNVTPYNCIIHSAALWSCLLFLLLWCRDDVHVWTVNILYVSEFHSWLITLEFL